MWDWKNMQSNESEGTTSRKTLAETEGMDDLPFWIKEFKKIGFEPIKTKTNENN